MSTLSTSGRNYARDGINSGIAAGSAVSYPRIEFREGATVLASISMQTTPLAASSGGTSNWNPPQGESDWLGLGNGYEFTPTSAGTVDSVVAVNRDEEDIETYSVSTTAAGTGEWQFTSLDWTTSEPVRITATPTASHNAS